MRWESIGKHAAAVVLIAGICRFLAWAASVSYAAAFRLKNIDHRENAEQAFYVTGSLALIGATLHLTFAG